MVRCFTKVSEEEIVAINEAAFFYPSDLVNTKGPFIFYEVGGAGGIF